MTIVYITSGTSLDNVATKLKCNAAYVVNQFRLNSMVDGESGKVSDYVLRY